MSLRYRLRYSWSPFFSRFGTLLPVQLETIPKILDGSNVVIMSPTASGKTEAVIAPVAEKCVMEQWQGLSILYIVPTRALANDTFQRIQGPLLDMNLTTAIKHQDTPYLSYKNLPNLLITTPESLDSLICRHSQIFSTLKTVILDEIHLLDNTYRGDQLRLLLWRLQKLANEGDLSIHLLSATLAYPHQVAKRYVKIFEVIEIKGQRVIDYRLFSSLSAVFEWVRRERWKKVLCFCNLRDSVESVAHELAELWHPYPVVVHHGSLHRREREEAEKVMKDSNVAVCVSTSTLEIGIDIGDIDLILLIEPPWSISSMIQRIGRGNRRENVARVAAIFKSNEEKSLLETMFNFAISGALDEAVYTPDRSVAIQQIFSFLFQNPKGMPESIILDFLSTIYSKDEAKLIIGHLEKNGWIERIVGGWAASTKLMDLGEAGRIHSNIPDSQIYRVIDTNSGKEIGCIGGVFDDIFILSGRVWRVVSIEKGVIKVCRFHGKASAPPFRKNREQGAFYWLLPPELMT